MKIEYFTNENAAATAYDALALVGISCLISGPSDYVEAPNADNASTYDYDADGKGGIYVVISELEGPKASTDIPKFVPKPK